MQKRLQNDENGLFLIRDFAYDLHRCVLQVPAKTAVQKDALLTIYGAICKCDDIFLQNRKISELFFGQNFIKTAISIVNKKLTHLQIAS